MEVTISKLRSELADWLARAREGEEIIVTDRGIPVARLSSVETAPLIEQLTQSGILSKPRSAARPTARGASRVQAHGSVADLVSEQRR
jgi:prevent-host-death family protein